MDHIFIENPETRKTGENLEIKRYMSQSKARRIYRQCHRIAAKNPGTLIHVPVEATMTMMAIEKEKYEKALRKEMRGFAPKRAKVQYDICEKIA